jgi:hypothetical protein
MDTVAEAKECYVLVAKEAFEYSKKRGVDRVAGLIPTIVMPAPFPT